MIAFGVWLAPRGVFDRLGRLVSLALLSGAAMILVAQLAKPLGPFVSAPLSLLGYAGTLWLVGGVDRNQLAMIRTALGSRFAATPDTSIL